MNLKPGVLDSSAEVLEIKAWRMEFCGDLLIHARGERNTL